jgi:hypothetical protein
MACPSYSKITNEINETKFPGNEKALINHECQVCGRVPDQDIIKPAHPAA